MAKTQTLLVVLLIFAIVFSIASVLLTLSLDSYKPAKVMSPPQNFEGVVSGNSAGGVGLVIEPRAGGLP